MLPTSLDWHTSAARLCAAAVPAAVPAAPKPSPSFAATAKAASQPCAFTATRRGEPATPAAASARAATYSGRRGWRQQPDFHG